MIAVTLILVIYAILVLLVLVDTQHQQNIRKGISLRKEDDNKRDAA